MDGWMDRWIDGRMDGRTEGLLDGWMGGWTDGRKNRIKIHILFKTFALPMVHMIEMALVAYAIYWRRDQYGTSLSRPLVYDSLFFSTTTSTNHLLPDIHLLARFLHFTLPHLSPFTLFSTPFPRRLSCLPPTVRGRGERQGDRLCSLPFCN